MAIKITVNDANNDGAGIDFTAYLADYDATYVAGSHAFGYFSSSLTDYSGNQYANTEQNNLTPDITKQSVVFESGGGSNSIEYNFATHIVGGDLDAISFGYGLSYDKGTDSFSLAQHDLRISGLGFVNQTGPNNIVGKLLNDAIAGDITNLNDLLAANSIEFYGSSGDDVFTGFAKDDTLIGGGGDDVLSGGDGNDILAGGAGNDTLEGGSGSDTYVYDGQGTDVINAGFVAGLGTEDVIQISKGFNNFADVIAATTDVGGDAIIDFGGGNTLTITGVTKGSLHEDDFTFAPFDDGMTPIANDDSVSTVKSLSTVIDVLANDMDGDGGTLDPATVTIVDGPANGTVTVNTATGEITYKSAVGYVGADSFTYTVTDNDGNVSSPATVDVDVAAAHILTSGNDVFSGDSLQLWAEGSEVHGGKGHDYIVTSNSKAFADKVYGGDGNDLIFTGGGDDYVEGGAGNDVIHARGGNDTVIGGAGKDTFVVRFTDKGTTTIIDDDGALFHGTFRPNSYPATWSPGPGATNGFEIRGTATFVSAGVYSLVVVDQNDMPRTLTLAWTGGDLTITESGNPQTVVIKDYVNGKFGINFSSEIRVSGNGVDIADGDTSAEAADGTAFGMHAVGDVVEQTFTVTNDGAADLKLSGLKLPSGFRLAKGEKLPSSLASGESATFKVVLDTKKAGHYSGVISLKTNDPDEGLFDFVVAGTVYSGAVPPLNPTGDATDNIFVATADAEVFSGLDGNDTVSYEDATGGVVANLLSPAKNKGFAAGDYYESIENLRGSDFNDTLTGEKGDNVLEGGAGADKLDGGAGMDTASYANASSGVTADLTKAANNAGEAAGDTYKNIENLHGSSFDDRLVGDAKANTIDGGDGDDLIVGGGGIDRLTGGDGSDVFMFNAIKDGGGATKAGAASDIITDFASGTDKIGILRSAFKIAQEVDLGTGDAFDFANYFVSGDGLHPLTSNNQSGVTATATGHGQFLFNEATSQLWWDPDGSGKGKAVLLAEFENGEQITAADFELLSRNVKGDANDNTFAATADAEAFFGFDGTDTVSYEDATAGVVANLASPARNTGFAQGDLYFSIENLTGSAFNDTLTGDKGNNVLEGGAGADKLDGGAGIDTASYANAAAGITADLTRAANNAGEAAGDTYKNIENLLGSDFEDRLVGNNKANAIDGGDGDDVIVGGGGIDTLTGGTGADTFVFNAIKDGGGATKAGAASDVITDFVSGEDMIGILRSAFKIADTVDDIEFAANYFVTGDGSNPLSNNNQSGVAATATGHGQFLFNEATSQLWWDADGAGNGKATLLAEFENGAHILASDFNLL